MNLRNPSNIDCHCYVAGTSQLRFQVLSSTPRLRIKNAVAETVISTDHITSISRRWAPSPARVIDWSDQRMLLEVIGKLSPVSSSFICSFLHDHAQNSSSMVAPATATPLLVWSAGAYQINLYIFLWFLYIYWELNVRLFLKIIHNVINCSIPFSLELSSLLYFFTIVHLLKFLLIHLSNQFNKKFVVQILCICMFGSFWKDLR